MLRSKVIGIVFCGSFVGIFPKTVCAIVLNGPIIASTVTVAGNVTVSSMTGSTLTVTTIDVRGKTVGMPGRILQTQFSSSTITTTVTSTTFTAVSNISQSITLLNANDYIRISLSGNLTVLCDPNTSSSSMAHITIFRDSTNLGDTSLGLSASSCRVFGQPVSPVGIRIKDSPGDTNAHTYQVYIRTDDSANPTSFPYIDPGYLLLEEIGQR